MIYFIFSGILIIPWLLLGFLDLAGAALRGSPGGGIMVLFGSIIFILIGIGLYIGIKRRGFFLVLSILSTLVLGLVTIPIIMSGVKELKASNFSTCGGKGCYRNMVAFLKKEGAKEGYTLITDINEDTLIQMEGFWSYPEPRRWGLTVEKNTEKNSAYTHKIRSSYGNEYIEISPDKTHLITSSNSVIYLTSKGIFWIYNIGAEPNGGGYRVLLVK